MLLADGPRQVINALTLYTLAASAKFSTNVNDYYEGNIFTAVMLLTMIFTVVIFAGSAILLLIAALMYVPLLCYIQGNLKEYCCHKIDKRISELVKRKKKQRLAKQAAIARKEAAGDFSHLKNKKGQIVGQAIPQPTLPAVDVDLFSDDKPGAGLKRNPSVGSSTAHGGYGMHGGSTDKLAYESPSFGPTRYGGRPDTDSLYDGSHAADDYSSTAHLVMHPGEAGGYSAPGARESPDAYPVHARGPGEFPAGQHPASPAMLAAMGPIGTSPELFAQRVRGQSPAPSAASAAQQQQQALLDAMGPIGTSPMLMAQQVRSRSPLAPREQYAPSRQQQQQQYAETYANAGVDYPPTPQANGVAGLEFPPPPPPDMSNYVPLSGPGGGEQVSHSQHGHGYSHDAYAASAPSPRSGHPADTSPPVPDHAAYDDIYDAYDAYDAYAGVQEDVRGPDGPQDGIYHEQRTRQGVYGQQDYDYNQYADAWGGNAHQQQHQQQQHGHAHGQAHGHAQGQGQYGYEGYSNAQDAYDKHGGFAR